MKRRRRRRPLWGTTAPCWPRPGRGWPTRTLWPRGRPCRFWNPLRRTGVLKPKPGEKQEEAETKEKETKTGRGNGEGGGKNRHERPIIKQTKNFQECSPRNYCDRSNGVLFLSFFPSQKTSLNLLRTDKMSVNKNRATPKSSLYQCSQKSFW